MSRHVTLVCGPPCAGKTTWARQHATPETLVLDWDDMARAAGSTARWNHARRFKDAAEARMQRAITQLAAADTGRYILIRTAADPDERQALAELVRADEVVVLTPPRDVLYQRAQQRTVPTRVMQAIDRWFALNQAVSV